MSDLTFSNADAEGITSAAGHSTPNGHSTIGTLMWIGESTSPEFHDAYQHCLAHAAQLALRRNFDDALCRPAAAVRSILVAQSTRQQPDRRCLDLLCEKYPQASFFHLQGTLCEGMRAIAEPTFGINQHYWHRWNQVLPQWLDSCGVSNALSHQITPVGCRSVAVLTSTFSAGEALLDLAESAGATAVWVRRPETHRIRNVDTVWWDDSVAGPTSRREWQERIAAFSGQPTQHAWIVNSPRLNEHREATRGGIDMVVSKPHRIDCLVQMLTSGASTSDQGRTPVSRAA